MIRKTTPLGRICELSRLVLIAAAALTSPYALGEGPGPTPGPHCVCIVEATLSPSGVFATCTAIVSGTCPEDPAAVLVPITGPGQVDVGTRWVATVRKSGAGRWQTTMPLTRDHLRWAGITQLRRGYELSRADHAPDVAKALQLRRRYESRHPNDRRWLASSQGQLETREAILTTTSPSVHSMLAAVLDVEHIDGSVLGVYETYLPPLSSMQDADPKIGARRAATDLLARVSRRSPGTSRAFRARRSLLRYVAAPFPADDLDELVYRHGVVCRLAADLGEREEYCSPLSGDHYRGMVERTALQLGVPPPSMLPGPSASPSERAVAGRVLKALEEAYSHRDEIRRLCIVSPRTKACNDESYRRLITPVQAEIERVASLPMYDFAGIRNLVSISHSFAHCAYFSGKTPHVDLDCTYIEAVLRTTRETLLRGSSNEPEAP